MVKFTRFVRHCLTGGMAIVAAVSPASAADPERWAQLVDTVFMPIIDNNKLSATSDATAFAEDGNGFLWVGSQLGLARWDGYHFRTYQPAADTPDALPDNYINALHTDPTGRLWIGTNSGGLALHDRERDRFIVYADGLSHVNVNAIADDGAGGLWVGTMDGLDRLDPATGVVRHLRHDANDSTSLPNNRVLALRRDGGGALWVGTSGGLARMDRGANDFSVISLPVRSARKSDQIPQVSALFEDSSGRMWIGTRNQGAYVVAAGESAATPVQETGEGTQSTLADETVRTVVEIRPGIVWIGTDSQGIVAVDTDGLHTQRIRHDPTLPSSLGNGAVFALYRDRAGLIWVGTDRSFSRHDATQTAVSTIFGTSSRQDSLSAADVAAVLEMPGGRVWLGMGNNGIDVLDPAGVRLAALRPDPRQPERALPRTFVTALVAAADADVFIGTRQGLYRADSAARGVVRVSVPQRLATDDVSSLLSDDGVLWVAGNRGLRGLDVGGAGAAARIRFASAAELTDQRISIIGRSPDRSLWVGTENGLNRIDFAALTVERIMANPADPQALPLGYVSSLLFDGRGRLWVGTLGGGIGVLQIDGAGSRARFVRLVGLAQGLRNNNINQLLQDARGRIWASTDDGIAVIDPETFAVRMLQSADGVAIQHNWAPSGARTAAGELLFGGAGGLTLIRPDRLKPWTYRPPIVVTSLRVGGKLTPGSRFNAGAAADPLTVAPDANSLAVEFAALDYSAPERIRYAYRLEGYDKDWVEADTNQRVAAYTNLAPGNYVLRLRGSNRNGDWTQTTLPVPIRVLPAWFQTLGFRFLLSLAGLALLVGLMQVRTAYLRHRQRELERQIADRTASLKLRTDELQESQRQLEMIAYFDVLTRLPNRRRFKDRMGLLMAQRQGVPGGFAVLLIDLDRFKQINDTLGHEAGDELLQEAAARFKACVRDGDTVARLGGDEFVVLLPDVGNAEGAAAVAREILAAIGRPFLLAAHDFRVTASIGIGIYPGDGRDEQTLLKNADIAMYQAKAEGKNNFQFYAEALNSNSLERLTLESSLRHALEHHEFQLHYQAKRDIASGQMSGVEALLRWQHPDLGTVAPRQFIPVAEETGLIVPIGKWVLKTACLQNVAWQQQGLPRLSIAVNLTARQFSDDRLLEDIASILADTGMDAALLELEIDESLMMRDIEKTVRILTALKSMGIRLAIDDFGAGYSSLATLQKFPLDTIKIAGSFIRDITSVVADSDLTAAVIAMGRSLSLTVVAQGVETRDQAEFLRQHACDELQGFYFNRPLPAEQFGKLLHAQAAGITYVGERATLQKAI